eukprot:TRINITY_DN13320_c0_g2_i1.p1 TRINITY_DN13320_c0_g2~~TRINITY_DN13320_c0_g2_i1.p1  ORF type:complete len:643 (+),score=105.28 TRINITY_DN13320_c0_g2_i1:76-2004(+)
MIDYNEDLLIALIPRLQGSVFIRSCWFAIPASLISFVFVILDLYIVPNFLETLGIRDMKESQLWHASTGILFMLLSFRTNRAMARFWEGTSLLHQMRGEWFDSVSCCVTFSRGACKSKPREVEDFRHTIVRLMSLCHGSALEEIAGDTSESIPTIDSLGLDNATLHHLQSCKDEHDFNRVEVLLHLIQSMITVGLDDGILKIPPPILSRVYQTLSRGFVNLLNAKKIKDTRFPFPYAQLIAGLLLINVVVAPMVIAALLTHPVWCPLFTFMATFAMFALNFVGVELENPFGDDDNDLPLDHFQSEMNKCLIMLLHENADLIPGVSKSRCVTNFTELVDSMTSGGGFGSGADFGHRISDFGSESSGDKAEVAVVSDGTAPAKSPVQEKPPPPAMPPVSASTTAPPPEPKPQVSLPAPSILAPTQAKPCTNCMAVQTNEAGWTQRAQARKTVGVQVTTQVKKPITTCASVQAADEPLSCRSASVQAHISTISVAMQTLDLPFPNHRKAVGASECFSPREEVHAQEVMALLPYSRMASDPGDLAWDSHVLAARMKCEAGDVPEECGIGEAMVNSIDNFSGSLEKWAHLVKDHVSRLNKSFSALQELSAATISLLDTMQSGHSKSSWGKRLQEERLLKTVQSLQTM